MSKIAIQVVDFYNNPSYFHYMPESIFNSLEIAFLQGSDEALVPEDDFIMMNNKILANHGIEEN